MYSKIFVTVFVAMFALTVPATAQTGGKAGRGGIARGMRGRGAQGGNMQRSGALAKQLNLTPEQQEKFKAIQADQKTKAKAIQSDASLSSDEKKTQLAALQKAGRKQMMDALTPEQKAKFKAIMDKTNAQKGDKTDAPATDTTIESKEDTATP